MLSEKSHYVEWNNDKVAVADYLAAEWRFLIKTQNHIGELFLAFLKIGTFTFGGGYAMIPLIQREIVERHQWIEEEDLIDMVAISESTPGPIAVNSATFVGYRVGGFWSAFAATFGVVLPSFLIILAISLVLRQFEENPIIQYAFAGIRVGVLALIVKALLRLYRQCPKNWLSYLLMAVALIAVAYFDVNAIFVIIGCAAASLFVSWGRQASKKN